MLSHARRFLLDLRQVGVRWVATISMITFVVASVLTYSLPFAVAEARSGTLSPQAPREPLSFLRVIDPNASIVSSGDEGSMLDTPGMRVLLDQLGRHPNAFLTLPLQAFTTSPIQVSNRADVGVVVSDQNRVRDGVVVVGAAPPFLDDAVPDGGPILLWGSIAGQVPEIDDTRLGPHAVQQVDSATLRREYVDGSGRIAHTQDDALLAMTTETAREVGVYSYDVAEVSSGLTCYCDAAELEAVASAMTDAEQRAGTDRVYYALGYDGLIGPLQRSAAVGEVLVLALPVGTLLSVCCFFVMATRLFWGRRAHAYHVETVCGAGETALQLRQQLMIALSLTLPAIVGFAVIDLQFRDIDAPLPWPPGGGPGLIVAAACLQLAAGAGTAIRVHRLCSHTQEEGRHA